MLSSSRYIVSSNYYINTLYIKPIFSYKIKNKKKTQETIRKYIQIYILIYILTDKNSGLFNEHEMKFFNKNFYMKYF